MKHLLGTRDSNGLVDVSRNARLCLVFGMNIEPWFIMLFDDFASGTIALAATTIAARTSH